MELKCEENKGVWGFNRTNEGLKYYNARKTLKSPIVLIKKIFWNRAFGEINLDSRRYLIFTLTTP